MAESLFSQFRGLKIMSLDHELKLGRARKHLEDLNAEIAGWLNGYVCAVRQEYAPDTWAFPDRDGSYILAGSVPLPGFTVPEDPPAWGRGLVSIFIDDVPNEKIPDSFGLLVSDFLHSLRSGLDNLAYALMLAGPGPVTDKMKGTSEFPIFGDEDAKGQPGHGPGMFAAAAHKYVGWKPGAKAAVESLQPYHRGQRFTSDPLWWLHELDRIDKHRFLHTAVTYSVSAGWRPIQSVNLRAIGPGFITAYAGPVERGAPVVRIGGIHLADAHSDVHMEVNPAFNVVFSTQAPAVGEKPVLQTAATIYNHIGTNVMPALSQFL
jgi:hypothetical protein